MKIFIGIMLIIIASASGSTLLMKNKVPCNVINFSLWFISTISIFYLGRII